MTQKDTPLPPHGGSWIHDPVTGALQRAVDAVPAVVSGADTLPPSVAEIVSNPPTKEKSK